MIRTSFEQLEKMEWVPRHFQEKNGIKYGYEKAKDSQYTVKVDGTIIDFVRLPAGHTIPAHYHNKAEEVFVVVHGSATFQTRMNNVDKPTETIVNAGDIFRIQATERHRTQNRTSDYLYLVRFAKKEDNDNVHLELDVE